MRPNVAANCRRLSVIPGLTGDPIRPVFAPPYLELSAIFPGHPTVSHVHRFTRFHLVRKYIIIRCLLYQMVAK